VPAGTRILVEPSHNTPPMGSYFTAPSFYQDYVLWRSQEKDDYYHLVSLDVYDLLYRSRNDDEKRKHIQDRLAGVDYIVMDDTYLQFYEHLPEAQHRVVKQYYRDLMAGRLGFQLQRTFKVYPSLFGWDLVDDRAELTFRLFDHPRIFIFRRAAPSGQP
jgi:hypothetical protein